MTTVHVATYKIGDDVVFTSLGELYLRRFRVKAIDDSSEAPVGLIEHGKDESSETFWARPNDVALYDAVPAPHQTWIAHGIVEEGKLVGCKDLIRFIRFGPCVNAKRKYAEPQIGDVVLVQEDEADPHIVKELRKGGSFVLQRVGSHNSAVYDAPDVRVINRERAQQLRTEAEHRLAEKKRKLMALAADLLSKDELSQLLSGKVDRHQGGSSSAALFDTLTETSSTTPIRPLGARPSTSTYARKSLQ